MHPALVMSALLGWLLLATGCSSPWKRDLVYSKAGVALYRECRLDGENVVPLGHRHPILVDVPKVAVILSQLTWRNTYFLDLKKPKDLHIFTPQEVELSAAAMSQALRTIKPDERLRFLITRSNWTEAFLGTQATSGVMFSTREGFLEIAFDRIQEGLADGEGGDPMKVTFSDPVGDPGGDPILPTAAVMPHIDPETGIDHPRWVEIQLDQVRFVAAAPAAAPPGTPSPGAPTSATAPPTAAAPAPATAGSPTQPDPYQRVRDRIEKLKRLRADGTITEEEYTREFEKAISEL